MLDAADKGLVLSQGCALGLSQLLLVPPRGFLATDSPHLCFHPRQCSLCAGLSPCAHRARLPQACLALVLQFLQVPDQPSSDLNVSKWI